MVATDYNSSLPVRTEANGDVVSKLCDGSTTSQLLAINTNGRIGINVRDGTTDGQVWKIDSDGYGRVDIAKSIILRVSKDTNANSESNPIFVQTSQGISGGEIHDYQPDLAVAAGDDETHTYTVTAAKTLLLKQITASSAGKMKAELKTGGIGATDTVAVFYNSTANQVIDFTFAQPKEVIAEDLVEIIKTNKDKAATDLHSPLIGVEV